MGITASDDGIFYNGKPEDLRKEITERFSGRENKDVEIVHLSLFYLHHI